MSDLIRFTDNGIQVDEAPDQSLISLELIRQSRLLILDGDTFVLGVNGKGVGVVYYKVVGWSPDDRAVIVQRTP